MIQMIVGRMHPSWESFLTDETFLLLKEILIQLGPHTNPEPQRMLRFLETNCDELKVVILGQDPYPAVGVATGRAFEVGGLTSWLQPFRQISLKNILRAVYLAQKIHSGYFQGDFSAQARSYAQIKEEMHQGSFKIRPPHELFSVWESQGVLLLNTSFSTVPGLSGSHAAIWEPFTRKLIRWISEHHLNCHWFLWGTHAQRFLPLISGNTYCSRHPMMCSEKYADDFLKNPCFLKTADDIDWTGMSVV